jgi:hypothetical protein
MYIESHTNVMLLAPGYLDESGVTIKEELIACKGDVNQDTDLGLASRHWYELLIVPGYMQ